MDEQKLRKDYEKTLIERTIRQGRIVALVAFVFIPVFAFLDVTDLKLANTLVWRGIGLGGFIGFFICSFVPACRQYINVIYTLTVLATILMMIGITLVVFADDTSNFRQVVAVTFGHSTVWLSVPYAAGGTKRMVLLPCITLVSLFLIVLVISSGTDYLGFALGIAMVSAFSISALHNQAQSDYKQFYFLQHLNENNIKLEAQAKALEIANNDLSSFNFSISHDLRAPSRIAHSFMQLLERDLVKGRYDRVPEYMEHINKGLLKMDELTEALLSFSSYGAKRLKRERIALKVMVEKVAHDVTAYGTKPVQIEIAELPDVLADRVLIEQVLVNLLSNAVKYSSKKEAPLIQVGSYQREDGKSDVVFVRDNGAGFKQKLNGKLFNVFKRLHGEDEFTGTGIGLAIVKRIIQHHNGEVWAEGEEGKGACFYFSLPRPRE